MHLIFNLNLSSISFQPFPVATEKFLRGAVLRSHLALSGPCRTMHGEVRGVAPQVAVAVWEAMPCDS